jgi:hypothetical protein
VVQFLIQALSEETDRSDVLRRSICDALAGLLEALPAKEANRTWQRALDICDQIDGEYLRSRALLGLERVGTLAQVSRLYSRLEAFSDQTLRAEGFAHLATRLQILGSHDASDVTRLSAQMITAIEDADLRDARLRDLAPAIEAMPIGARIRLWAGPDGGLLRELAARTREDLLSDVVALAPVIRSVDESSPSQSIKAVVDVAAWWP